MAIVALSLVAAQSSAAEPTYVGASSCAECHRAESERWQGSHHQQAMLPTSPKSVRGNFGGARFEYNGVASTFRKNAEQFVVRTDGPDGKLADYPVAYTFGVSPLQQYLVAFPGGRYQALSVAWDTRPAADGGQRWFHLYPDEKVDHADVLHWTGPAQNWNAMCADCHSTNLRRNYKLESNTYDTTWTDVDVACEACHGPGSAHVAWARAGAKADDAARGLVVRLHDAKPAQWVFDSGAPIAHRNPPRTSNAELETCAPCHARRTVILDPAMPGGPLLDSYRPALLDDGLYFADGQIHDEVYEYGSFVQSRMFQAGVSCSDCHEPHSLGLVAEGNALCGRCHAPVVFDTPAHHHHKPGSAAAACVQCHMPSRLYMVIDSRRDHSFRVPRPDLSVAIGSPNACNACHKDRDAAWAAKAVQGWEGTKRWREPHYGQAIAAGRRGDVGAGQMLARVIDDSTQPAIVRGTAASLLGAYLSPSTLPALQRALGAEDGLVRLGALEAVESVPPNARPVLALPLVDDPLRALRIEAARTLAGTSPQALTDQQKIDLNRGLDEYRKAQAVQADRPESHLNLALLALAENRVPEAQAELETAMRLGPQFVPAYVNLADLYRSQNRDGDAEALLRRALVVAPDVALTHHALGLLLVRQKKVDEATRELRRAAELDTTNARYAYVLAIALSSSGKTQEALAVLRLAHEHRPGDRDILIALATISRDAGAMGEAKAWAEKLLVLDPDDAQVKAFVRSLGSAN